MTNSLLLLDAHRVYWQVNQFHTACSLDLGILIISLMLSYPRESLSLKARVGISIIVIVNW